MATTDLLAGLRVRRYGRRGGRPLLYHHGWPGAASEAFLIADAAVDQGWDLVAFDRPGTGGSPPIPTPGLAPIAVCARRLADHLGWDRFAQVGVSGGAPFAAVTAALLGPRVQGTLLVCGMAPMLPEVLRHLPIQLRSGLRLARAWPGAAPLILRGLVAPRMASQPRAMLALLTLRMAAADRIILADPEVLGRFARIGVEAFAQGGIGPVRDLLAFAAPWATAFARPAPVLAFHGEEDQTLGVGCLDAWSAVIPGLRAVRVPGEGHFSLPLRQGRRILREFSEILGGG